MIEITYKDYLNFIQNNNYVEISGTKIKLQKEWNITTYSPPSDYVLEKTTVWSFPDRGTWATHRGNYRGNWSPYIPRNLILKYTTEGDYVLDQMVGSGTTLVEAKLLNRNAIGIDINKDAIILTQDRLNFQYTTGSLIKTFIGDAQNLEKITDNSIDLIATHPPYANIISYTKKEVKNDISKFSFPKYIEAMKEIALESYRVLKPGKICAILIGDTRKYKHYVPISYKVLESFLIAGFILKEEIIKLQWNMKETREKWSKGIYNFYLIAHEHIFVLEKPRNKNEYKKYKFSTKEGLL